ncbi:MAG: hypothetical protein DMF64_05860 [Acidobacteria bacterium]|nr:MAG: hypothetical protein DMF64_05860 [Acidobacteriota bacterium]
MDCPCVALQNGVSYEYGNNSEAIVLAAYLVAGFSVSITFGAGASYDLVVDNGSRLFKIQVKTAWLSEGCVQYKSQRRQPGGKLTRRTYREGEVDYFVAYCPVNKTLYAVPAKKPWHAR